LKLNEIEPCSFFCEVRSMCLRYRIRDKTVLDKLSYQKKVEYYKELSEDDPNFGTLNCPKLIRMHNLIRKN
jgi:hypothetical protein